MSDDELQVLTVRCSECGKAIYADVAQCPYCGCWTADEYNPKAENSPDNNERMPFSWKVMGLLAALGLLIPTILWFWYKIN